jgi:hypothetical protein
MKPKTKKPRKCKWNPEMCMSWQGVYGKKECKGYDRSCSDYQVREGK